jgi:MFS family permease
MLLLSSRAGRLAQRIGPRIPMTVGPLIVSVGLVLLAQIGAGSTYLADVLPGTLIQALGLSLTVAPLTATALASAPDRLAGVASAVNNDVARVAGLIAVAVLPALGGIHGSGTTSPQAFSDAFHMAAYICAALCVAGGLLAAFTIGNVLHEVPQATEASELSCCPVSGPQIAARNVVAAEGTHPA